ncbi:SDR family oxidoreductase [Plantactinospora sp. WMMB334]|uniref:SDR family oxidoreductase n=1 Tax=Plantactinospora sp. WMMB334 TaxID=3404119 RepID=UPI003B956CAF
MQIEGSVALVTGSNRGIGRHYVEQLIERGAAKVYATSRNGRPIDVPGAVPLPLEITDPGSVSAVAEAAADVTLLVNNAGVDFHVDVVAGDLATVRREMEVNYFGTLSVVRAFAPVLARNGGGAIVNVLSALSWFSWPGEGAYAAAKAAAWSMTNSIRLELAAQGTHVTGVHVGAVDTDFSAGYNGPKVDPADVARATLDGLASDAPEVLVDKWSADIKAALVRDPGDFYAQFSAA